MIPEENLAKLNESPPSKSEFVQPQDWTLSQYYHTCNPNVRPYALVKIIERGKRIIVCSKCRHTETWVLNPTDQRWTIEEHGDKETR